MIINIDKVLEARQIIEDKKGYWENHGFNFDKDGRMELKGYFNLGNEIINLMNNASYDWKKYFVDYMKKNDYEVIGNYDLILTYDKLILYYIKGWEENLITFRKLHYNKHTEQNEYKYIKIKATKVLETLQKDWLHDNPEYCYMMDKIKELRKAGYNYENSEYLVELTERKKYIEKKNLYIQYNIMLNKLKNDTVIVSINPIDLLFSSGDRDNSLLTQFESCWSNEVRMEDGELIVESAGCYADPYIQFLFGSLNIRGIIFMKNKNSITVGDMEFYGYEYRSHIWLDELKGVFVEKCYPQECLTENFYSILHDNSYKTFNPILAEREFMPINGQYYFDIKDLVSQMDGSSIFLDRTAIDTDNMEIGIITGRTYYDYDDEGWAIPWNNTTCCRCGEVIDDSDTRYVDGEDYCDDCFNELFSICAECGDVIDNDESYCHDGSSYCEYCYNKQYTHCNECGESIEIYECYNGYCEDCFNEKYGQCRECGCEEELDSMTDGYCSDCYEYIKEINEDEDEDEECEVV